MKYPFLTIVVISVLLTAAGCGQVVGQVILDENYHYKDGQIPYGEHSGINGKTAGLQSLALVIYYRTKKEIIPISVHTDGSWAGILPPFSPKTRVLFQFSEFKLAGKEDKERVYKLLDTTYTRFNDAMTKFVFPNAGMNEVRAKAIVDSLFEVNINPGLAQYRSRERKTLDTLIAANFREFTATANSLINLLNFSNSAGRIDRLSSSITTEWEKLKIKGLLNPPITIDGRTVNPSSFTAIPESLISNPTLLDILKSATVDIVVKGEIDAIKATVSAYSSQLTEKESQRKPIDEFNRKQQSLLVFAGNGQIFVTTLATESLESAEILKYASIDVSGLIFPNANLNNSSPTSSTVSVGSSAGFFFSVNPYFQDFMGPNFRKNLRKKSNRTEITQGYGLAPMLGVALFQMLGDNPKPIYFVGGSVRLNEAFRLNAGWSFFKQDKSDEKFQWLFGLGASLRISSVGDLLRLFNATTSELPNNLLPD